MIDALPAMSFPLFVPGDRADRFAKAVASGSDTVIIDLEDAVAPANKAAARAGLAEALGGLAGARLWLRVNAAGTPWHEGDIAAAARLPFDGVMLPKSTSGQQLQTVRQQLRADQALIALVETVHGVHRAEEIASASDRMAFGSVDYALDLGCQPVREAFLLARSKLVLAARLAGQPPPLDGVTTRTDDADLVREDGAHACSLGFGGKLLIHPRQLAPARAGFAPDRSDIDWARRVMASAADGAAVALDGEMIDAPVLARAKAILERTGEGP